MAVIAEQIKDKERNKRLNDLMETASLALYEGEEAIDYLHQKQKSQPTPTELQKAYQETKALVVDFVSEGTLLSEGLNSPEIAKLMMEHSKLIPIEKATFKNYRWLDDLLLATTVKLEGRFTTEEYTRMNDGFLTQRKKELNDIHHVMLAAHDRQKKFYKLLKKFESQQQFEEQYKEAMEFAEKMMEHIPKGWLEDRETIGKRIEGLCRNPAEMKLAKDKALAILDEDNAPQRAHEVETLRTFIEYGSLKTLEHTIPYFDKPLRDPPQELQERMDRTIEKIIERAHTIKDNGGTIQEVENSMQHLPAQFWPPEFVRSLQAWRKVERELAEERVKNLNAEDPINFNDFADMAGFAFDALGFVAVSTDLKGATLEVSGGKSGVAQIPCAWRNAPSALEATSAFLSIVNDFYGFGVPIKEQIQAGDYDKAYELMKTKDPAYAEMTQAEALEKLRDRIAITNADFESKFAKIANTAAKALIDTSGTAISVVNNAIWGAKAAGDKLADTLSSTGNLVPVLCAVGAGIDLAKTIADLGKAINMRRKTGKLLQEAEIMDAAEGSPDGGALVLAICNERAARNRQVAQEGVNVVSKSLTFAGETTLATGVSAVVGLGLKVSGKTVEYAGKIAFASIDWKIAKDVKVLIKEAQAGNPIARLQLMEKSGLYAKMYIAIMAREGHPIARKFIVDRGMTESDIDNPAIAISILRDAMLQHANQKNEEEVSDNWFEETAKGVAGEGTVKIVKAIGKALVAPNDELLALEYPYLDLDAPDSDFELAENWGKDFDQAKVWCVFNTGLANPNNQLSKLIYQLSSCIKKLATMVTKYQKAIQTGKRSKPQKIIQMIAKIDENTTHAKAMILAEKPISFAGDIHQPMNRVLSKLQTKLIEEQGKIPDILFELNIRDDSWTPLSAPAISESVWKLNWNHAVRVCKVPKKDEGVGKALKESEKISSSFDHESTDKRTARKSLIKLQQQYEIAAKGIRSLEMYADNFPGLYTFLDNLIKLLLDESRKNDHKLNGEKWTTNPIRNIQQLNPSSANAVSRWQEFLNNAEEEGFITSANKDHKAGQTMGKLHIAIKALMDETEPKNKIALRKNINKLVILWIKALKKIFDENAGNHSDFLKVLAEARQLAAGIAANARQDQSSISFTTVSGLDETSWSSTYSNAVTAGAIPENKSAQKALVKSLKVFQKRRLELQEQAKDAQQTFQRAQKLVLSISNIQKSISKAQDADGFNANDQIQDHFVEMRELSEKELNKKYLQDALNGTNVKNFPSYGVVWPTNKSGYKRLQKDWVDIQKKAHKAGIFTKPLKTKLYSLFGSAAKKMNEMQTAKMKADAKESSIKQWTKLKKEAADTIRALKEKEVIQYNTIIETKKELRRLKALLKKIQGEKKVAKKANDQEALQKLIRQEEETKTSREAAKTERSINENKCEEYQFRIENLKIDFVAAQEELNSLEGFVEKSKQKHQAYEEVLDNIIAVASGLSNKTECTNFKKFFVDVINGARKQKEDLSPEPPIDIL